MKAKLLSGDTEAGGARTWALVFEIGDTVMDKLHEFAARNELRGAHFTAIGAFRDAVLYYFDWETKEYQDIAVNEQVEVLALTGNVSWSEDQPKVHAHVVLGTREGNARGGHLKEAHVRPTLEVLLTEEPKHLRRRYDEETGLPLIEL